MLRGVYCTFSMFGYFIDADVPGMTFGSIYEPLEFGSGGGGATNSSGKGLLFLFTIFAQCLFRYVFVLIS